MSARRSVGAAVPAACNRDWVPDLGERRLPALLVKPVLSEVDGAASRNELDFLLS
jgi:hypothetical protein